MRHRRKISQVGSQYALTLPCRRTTKVNAQPLINFSAICAAARLNPAQGVRILRTFHPVLWGNFKKKPTQKNLQLCLAAYKEFIQYDTPTITQYTPADYINLRDTHFLFRTNLPKNSADLVSIHFIRVQRRYNKRRYARVRATSRPSFWTGMTISTLAISMFWGASMQLTDWLSTNIIITNVTPYIALAYFITFLEFFKIINRETPTYTRETNKIRRGLKNYFRKLK